VSGPSGPSAPRDERQAWVTALIASSILLIAVSAGALTFGWIGENGALIWLSIAASVASGICLALAYYRSRAAVAAPPPPSRDPETVRVRPATEAPAPPPTDLFDAESGMMSHPAPPASDVPARPRPEAGGPDDVVAVPELGRFHRPSCRYAAVEGAVPMSRAAARRRAYTACGICRP
jgi:hypothetical protein